MKILVVTNLYPPHALGGYELGCREVVEELRSRGHNVRVLTSAFCLAGSAQEKSDGESDVERVLHFMPDADAPRADKRLECSKLAQTLTAFLPDVVYFWNQAGLCHWLPVVARWHRYRTAFFLSDASFVSWRVGAWLARWKSGQGLLSRAICTLLGNTFLMQGWPVVQNRPCHFASEFLAKVAKENRIPVAAETSTVAHWGINMAQFASRPREGWPPTRLLFVGRLSPQKGVHTAISALQLLTQEEGFKGITLTLAGGGPDQEYARKMRELPGQYGIVGSVNFLGELPRSKLAEVYAQHEILLFPSEWEEPFAITPLEAMASGLVVVGTTTGGSGELFRNRETAMTFATGSANDCVRALRELLADRALYEAIRTQAFQEVTARHTLGAMVDAIEASLLKLERER